MPSGRLGDLELTTDHDSDGCQDLGEDADDDDDGVSDSLDDCPTGRTGWTSNQTSDHDSDGCSVASGWEDDWIQFGANHTSDSTSTSYVDRVLTGADGSTYVSGYYYNRAEFGDISIETTEYSAGYVAKASRTASGNGRSR